MTDSTQRRRAQARRRVEAQTVRDLAGEPETNLSGRTCSHRYKLVKSCASCNEFKERLGHDPYDIPY